MGLNNSNVRFNVKFFIKPKLNLIITKNCSLFFTYRICFNSNFQLQNSSKFTKKFGSLKLTAFLLITQNFIS